MRIIVERDMLKACQCDSVWIKGRDTLKVKTLGWVVRQEFPDNPRFSYNRLLE